MIKLLHFFVTRDVIIKYDMFNRSLTTPPSLDSAKNGMNSEVFLSQILTNKDVHCYIPFTGAY